jgi:hypothetical protein
MTDAIITIILAENGKSRWCETAVASPSCARTFLQLYPQAKFLCLHRHCRDVVDATVRANPWGLGHSTYRPFASAHPTSSVAAVSAYWTAVAEPLLDFEASYPASCRRVRLEDLTSCPDEAAGQLCLFLGIDGHEQTAFGTQESIPALRTPRQMRHVPMDKLPTPLRAEVDRLLARIGYPPISDT